MAVDSHAAASAPRDTGRRIHLGMIVLILVLLFVQFYLAGRGVFGASHNYDAHKAVGNTIHAWSLILLIATIAIRSTRNRVDIGMAVALFVLATIQVIIGNFDHPQVGALHPVNALLIVGLSFAIFDRDRGAGASRAAAV
jgi:hypothetical protein